MAKPYSNDLRARVIEAIEEGATREEAAERQNSRPCWRSGARPVGERLEHAMSQ
jgi:hypothetical protein